MNELYLHKYKKDYLKTTKDTIIADLDKINKNYIYEESKRKKEPECLIITGQKNESFPYYTKIVGLPVKKVIIDCNIHDHSLPLCAFDNVKELEITDNVKNIEIYNNYGLKDLENITIPFTIESFDNNFISVNYLKTITIKYKELTHIIELDDVFKEKNIDISITNFNNTLNINIDSKYSNVNYKVFIDNDKLVSTKKYSRYEIIPKITDNVIDLIELRKNIDANFTYSRMLNCETLIVSKKDYKFISDVNFNKEKIKEIIIKDDNEMSLLPRTVKIDLKKRIIKNIELFNEKLVMKLKNEDKTDRFMLINDDLSYIEFDREHLAIIQKVYLDLNETKFNFIKEDGYYNITIPIKDNIRNSNIILYLVRCASEIIIKNKDKEILISKSSSILNRSIVSNIEKYNNDDFGVLYDEYINGGVKKNKDFVVYEYNQVLDCYIPPRHENYKTYLDNKKLIKK